MKLKNAAGILSVVMLLSGCATFPPGPSVMVLPGNGKPFEAFRPTTPFVVSGRRTRPNGMPTRPPMKTWREERSSAERWEQLRVL